MWIAKYDEPTIIYPSRMDCSGKLSIPDCFSMFMDIAAPHAALLECGTEHLAKKGLFWLTVRTKIHINRRPRLMEEVTVSTWPEAPEETRCVRNYSITKNGEPLVLGKTLWAVLNMQTGKLNRVDELYPEDFVPCTEVAVPEPFTRFDRNFEGETFGTYTVRSTDIDFGGHMNNVAYLRAFASLYSAKEWQNLNLTDIEIHYKTSAFEGNTLTFQKKQEGDETQVVAFLENGKPAVYIAMK